MPSQRILISAALGAALSFGAAHPLAAQSQAARDLAMFDHARLSADLDVRPIAVLEDSRCVDSELCFRDNRLRVAVIVEERGSKRAIELALGESVELESGKLTLVASNTAPSRQGAITAERYRLFLRLDPSEDR